MVSYNGHQVLDIVDMLCFLMGKDVPGTTLLRNSCHCLPLFPWLHATQFEVLETVKALWVRGRDLGKLPQDISSPQISVSGDPGALSRSIAAFTKVSEP